jgi:hypothetical protein
VPSLYIYYNCSDYIKSKIVIYVDQLGFGELAEHLQKDTNYKNESLCREVFLYTPLRTIIEELEKDPKITAIKGSDDYKIIIENDYLLMIEIISKISTIEIPIKGYNYIPLEIVADIVVFEEILGENITRTEVIKFLKTDLLTEYRNYYKTINKEPIKETFFIIGKSLHEKLPIMVKSYFGKIDQITEYNVFLCHFENILRRGSGLDFLKNIKHKPNSKYGCIDEIFVAPDNFNKILEILSKSKVVILTGEREYGKTYAAIRLLWLHYKIGYSILWKKNCNITSVIDYLHDFKNKEVVYFEDPFGFLFLVQLFLTRLHRIMVWQ